MMAPEGTDRVRINRKRAEGRDNSDKPKTLKLKARRLNPVNTTCYVQILGTGMDTHDTSPSVLLFFDKQRFIFNAGEGLQRFCTEHKIKLSKVDHIFLSRVCSENAGGLPGLLLTLAGMGDEGMSVNIWGPLDLKFLVGAMKSFIPKAAMVHSHSFGPIANPDGLPIPDHQKCIEPIVLIDDEVVKLSAILLRPSHLKEDRDHSPEPLLLHSPKRKAGSLVKPGDFSVMYVCELPEIKGRFDPEKALALGLKAGPKYRELQLGNSVVSDLDKNIMVHPENVMDPSIPGPIVFLVDCPTESHLQELLSIHYLNCYYTNFSGNPPEHAKTVSCVIHLSPASVTSSINYQKWMNRFGAAQHIMAGHQMKNVKIPILQSSARIAARLNYLCPRFFPSPVFCSPEQYDDSSPDSTASSEVHKLCETIPSENLLKFHLRPYAQLGLDRSGIPCMKAPSEIIDELLSEIPEIVDAAQQVSRFWQDPRELEEDPTPMQGNGVMIEEPWLNLDTLPSCLENINRKDMEIVLLGTGSSQPSKYRNVSSIYINLFSKGGFLLDCGEGTLGQLKRRYGVEGADNSVRGLKCIWISHIHADHHAGIARILTFRRDLLKGVSHEPLLVVGPTQLKGFLDAYQRLEDLDMQFLNCLNTMDSLDAFEGGANSNNSCSSMKSLKNVLSESGLEALISFPVVHCLDAFGVVLKAAERINNVGKVIPGWKIVYSGDTRPCTKLIEASCGATVLIHEATFEDALMEDAISKNHSTTNEAIQVGDSAGAYRIILTHFSQRYPKIPVIDESHMNKTCIAFDMMSVNLADLHILPKLLPHIKLLFKQEMIVDESDVLGGI